MFPQKRSFIFPAFWSYRLRVGDTQDGIKVLEADYSKTTVLIRRNGQEARLNLPE
jgi:hypothetical protein